MPKVFTYSEARQNLASVLNQAEQDGEVRVVRRNGQTFIIRPAELDKSPLDVPGLNLNLGVDEIVNVVREGRQRDYRRKN